MPIEINELVIRAISDDSPETSETSVAQGSLSEEEIVKACVKQVIQILKKQKER